MNYNIEAIRNEFPILNQRVNNKPLIYFDNAATSQKPKIVLEAIEKYYSEINANIHRGVHTLSQLATDAYEASRNTVKQHINAHKTSEVLFTSGTTMGINIIAQGFTNFLKPNDEIILSHLEHHSNIVPWQMLCERTGAVLKVIPMDTDGQLCMKSFDQLLSERTQIVTVNHISNALGIINPIPYIIKKAHEVGAAVLIDGAQAAPHLSIDVQALDCDFYVFSGHKICAPTGTGILYGKEKWLEKLPPYQGGGEMIKEVTFQKTTYAELPHKFEAGTPNIAGGIVLGTAINYLNQIGLDRIGQYENKLLQHATQALSSIDGLRIYGTSPEKASVVSFNIKDIHPYDIGVILDKMGIAVRTGHHCTQPIMQYFDIPGTVRASFAFYNTIEEIDLLVAAVHQAKKMLS